MINEKEPPVLLLPTPSGLRSKARGWPVSGPTPGQGLQIESTPTGLRYFYTVASRSDETPIFSGQHLANHRQVGRSVLQTHLPNPFGVEKPCYRTNLFLETIH